VGPLFSLADFLDSIQRLQIVRGELASSAFVFCFSGGLWARVSGESRLAAFHK
jgi:hypothetical protein